MRLPAIAKGTKWVAQVKAIDTVADTVLAYLGRYVHRTAIADGAIVGCTDETVTFRYRDSRTQERKAMTLPGREFLRRFLQHVLPKGLHRVRSYGLLHPTHRTTLRRLQLLLRDGREPERHSEPEQGDPRPRLRCPNCRLGSLILIRRLSADACLAMLATTTPTARAPPQPSAPQSGAPPP